MINKRSAREIKKFRDLAHAVIDRHFKSVKRLRYLSGGLTNFVFSFQVKEGDFVIRISPDPNRIGLFIKEQWAVNAARSARIPVAEILEVGSELIGLPYMIVASAKGGDAVDHPKRFEVLRELGRIAAKTHGVKTRGFGQTFDWSDNKLQGTHPSKTGFTASMTWTGNWRFLRSINFSLLNVPENSERYFPVSLVPRCVRS